MGQKAGKPEHGYGYRIIEVIKDSHADGKGTYR